MAKKTSAKKVSAKKVSAKKVATKTQPRKKAPRKKGESKDAEKLIDNVSEIRATLVRQRRVKSILTLRVASGTRIEMATIAVARARWIGGAFRQVFEDRTYAYWEVEFACSEPGTRDFDGLEVVNVSINNGDPVNVTETPVLIVP